MALQSLSGGFSLIGPDPYVSGSSGLAANAVTMNAANHHNIYIGRVVTADGGSHTIDTSGSSKISFRTDSVTFANAGTTVKVGIAPVDTSNGPPGRANNTTNVVNYDVSASLTGGGGGLTNQAWHDITPDSGTKTIANGDLVAVVHQMTARAGADTVSIAYSISQMQTNRPLITGYGGSYSARVGVPNVLITFSDGTLGWIEGGSIFTTLNQRTWNSGSATKEYGQLYQLPFPYKLCGLYGIFGAANDCDIIAYTDPLGTPVASKTASMDANTMFSTGAGNVFREFFDSPLSVAAGTPIGAVYKPGASNVTASYKTLNNAAHRVADPWGTSGYGISRASGAFANANSSLDHYHIGLIISAYDDAVSAGGGAHVIGS
jgi:hypothetical protein